MESKQEKRMTQGTVQNSVGTYLHGNENSQEDQQRDVFLLPSSPVSVLKNEGRKEVEKEGMKEGVREGRKEGRKE